MPQIATHVTIAQRTLAALPDRRSYGDNDKAFALGGIGPDMALFLFEGFVPQGSYAALNTAIDTLYTVADITGTLAEVGTKVSGPVDDFVDWITGGLSTQVSALVTTAFDAALQLARLQAQAGATVTVQNPFAGLGIPGIPDGPTLTVGGGANDVLRRMGHPYSSDPLFKAAVPDGDYSDWWWVDLLHYRRTGTFAAHLLGTATTPLLNAFSAGYMTHLAGDIAGHPYINALVGGPFRTNVIRHIVMERVVDAWVWNRYHQEDVIKAQLHRHLDVGDDIEPIARHLRDSMEAVFTNPTNRFAIRPTSFPGSLPSTDDIVRAYQLLLLFLRLSTSSTLERPQPPPGSPAELMAEIGDSIANTAAQIPQQFTGSMQWWEWLLAPFLAIANALVLLFKLLTLPAAVLARVVAQQPRWYAYFLQVALHDVAVNLRWSLCLTGWGLPSRDDLGRLFARRCVALPSSRTGQQMFDYPHVQPTHNVPAFWLADPRDLGAPLVAVGARAESCPYRPGSSPAVFIDGPGYDVTLDRMLREMARASSPAMTVGLERETSRGPQFGNAVDLGVRMITGAFPLASFDLDGDHGYGFLSWEGDPPAYTDANGDDLTR